MRTELNCKRERVATSRRATGARGQECSRAFVACRALLLAAAVFGFAVAAVAQRAASYANPVAPGDFPDPSVIRTGQDYWATATTSEWAPEFPVLHSRDLVNWEIVGAIFQQRPAWSVGSFWAPELSHYRGQFYVYYVARKKDGPLCVAVATARRATGPYTDHGPLVCQEVGSIDGFPVTDERGRRYLLWKEDGNSKSLPTPIWAQQLSADGTRLVGRRKEILRNTEPWEKHATLPYGDLIEGPAVVRRGGWFYMFFSGNFCCARECNYMMGVARARRLLGPWEKYPGNPILRGNENFKCPGHGTVVSDATGRDWLLYHAMDAKDFVYVGRQALLDEVKWGRDGWPTINEGRGPSTRADAPQAARAEAPRQNAWHGFFDDFGSPRLSFAWQWPQSNVPAIGIEAAGGGWLALAPTTGQDDNPVGAVVARPTTVGDYTATTAVETTRLGGGRTAGLAAYGDADNAMGLSVGGGRVTLWRRERKNDRTEQTTVETADAPAGVTPLHLRLQAREGRLYRFAFSRDGREWRDLGGEQDGSFLPPWDRGVRVALAAGGTPGPAARFAYMRVWPAR
jgi:beta-xylosidase